MLQHVQADAQSSSSTLYGSQFSVEDSPAPHSDELMYREGRARGIQGKGWPSGGPAGLPPVHQQGAVVLVLLSFEKVSPGSALWPETCYGDQKLRNTTL